MMPAVVSFFADATSQPQCVHYFLGLKPWYYYLNLNSNCSINLDLTQSGNWNQLWLIGIVVLNDLLFVAGVAAVAFVIYGGVRYLTSQGEPENTKAALSTIMNALIGLAIAAIATAAVDYIGNKLGGSSTVNGLPNIAADGGTVTTIFNIAFAIFGGIAVIMIVFGGFKYVTSRGEGQATAKAKDTILYALVGLTVILFASALVNFVLYEFQK